MLLVLFLYQVLLGHVDDGWVPGWRVWRAKDLSRRIRALTNIELLDYGPFPPLVTYLGVLGCLLFFSKGLFEGLGKDGYLYMGVPGHVQMLFLECIRCNELPTRTRRENQKAMERHSARFMFHLLRNEISDLQHSIIHI